MINISLSSSFWKPLACWLWGISIHDKVFSFSSFKHSFLLLLWMRYGIIEVMSQDVTQLDWICHAFLQPLLTFRSIEFYFWMLSSFYKNPIRALECPLPLHSVAQPRDKEAGLSVCNQITSLPGPQLRTGNLKFLASLQFPNPSLQSPLGLSAWPGGLCPANRFNPADSLCAKCSQC